MTFHDLNLKRLYEREKSKNKMSVSALGDFSISFGDIPYEQLASPIAEAIDLVRKHGK